VVSRPLCCVGLRRPSSSTLFPYTTLFRSVDDLGGRQLGVGAHPHVDRAFAVIREAPARFVELVGGDPEVEEHADGCGYPGLVEQAAEVGEIALEDGHVGMAGQVGMGERVGITVDAYESCSFSHLVHQSPRVPPT